MCRIDEIKAVLLKHGPMTLKEIGEKLDMTGKAVSFHVGNFRKYSKGIRVHSFDMTSPTRKERRFAIGTEPDARFPHKHRSPSALAKIKHPTKTRAELDEMQHEKLLKKLAAQTKAFRDPLIFMTAGRAP